MNHQENHVFTEKILGIIAKERQETVKRLKRRIFRDQDQEIMGRFWELVKAELPNHRGYELSYCPGCKALSID